MPEELTEQDYQSDIEGLGRRSSEARDLRGREQHFLANRLGVTRALISEFERGTRDISVRNALKIADVLEVNRTWLLVGDGPMSKEGPSLSVIRDQAWAYRNMEVDFIAAINAMLRKYRHDNLRMTWALASCIRAYWGAHWLGTQDMREMARIVEKVADACDLNLISVLESTGHSNASQYTADWLVHRNIDPEALGPRLLENGFDYEVRYSPELARSEKVLNKLAKEKGLLPEEENVQPSKVDQVVDYFVRWFGVRKR